MKLIKQSSVFKFFVLIPFIISGRTIAAQSYRTQQNQIFAYNILSNGIMGGVGGMINRPVNEKWHKSFIKNFGKGCLGGLVKYTAKSQTWYLQIEENNFLALPNRLLYFAGHSMVMNASKNKGIMDTYYCNLMGADIRWHIKKTNENIRPLMVRLSAQSLVSFLAMEIQNNKFDFYKSLEMGLLYFELDTIYTQRGVSRNRVGTSFFNAIAIRNYTSGGITSPYSFTVPHEIVHCYQAYDFFPLTHFYYDRYLDKKLMKISWWKQFNRFVVLDIDAFYYNAAYFLQPKPLHFKNFFEYEAQHFGNRQFIYR